MIFLRSHAPFNKLSSRHYRGLRIGLFGGSFNPPHAGHVLLAETMRKRLRLDAIMWLVSPGNPLKGRGPHQADLPPLIDRVRACRVLLAGRPRHLVTDIESQLGTRYTLDTVRKMRSQFPVTRFIWLCGQDIALQMHRWQGWRTLLTLIPFACMARPPHVALIRNQAPRRLKERCERHTPHGMRIALQPMRWHWILTGSPTSPLSSTVLRMRDGKLPGSPQSR